ncbi:MAG: hypothetical protein AAB176_06895 [Pseudomonadota bacterium]
MALNSELTWDAVGDIVTDSTTGTRVKDAFQQKFQTPSKCLVPALTWLYKFNRYKDLTGQPQGPDSEVSPWWSMVDPYQHDAGLEARLKMANLNGGIREWARLTSAISENWSTLEFLMKIQLAESVYGWFGGFAAMPRLAAGKASLRDASNEDASSRSKFLPGGATQIYIPNLKVRHVQFHKCSEL